MSWDHSIDTWIVVVGALAAMACALPGTFLVLRKLSMMGDAISHAVLPGLAIAFLWTGSRASIVMFVGAAVVGVLTAVFTQWVSSFGRVNEGASMGVVFTALFALGLVLIVHAADSVDLDPGCVLYGDILYVAIDLPDSQGPRPLLGYDTPHAVLPLACVLLVNLLFVVVFYKELKLSSFDPALGTALGFNANLMHYVLMVLVAVTTVAAFEAVGSILVIAMLIVPAAAARLLSDRLPTVIVLGLVIAALSAVGGHVAALTIPQWFGFADTSTSGMIAVTAGAIFLVVMLLAPKHGVLSALARRASLTLRIVREDLLGLLYRLEEGDFGERDAVALMAQARTAGSLTRWLAVQRLRRSGLIELRGSAAALTATGRRTARKLVRSHRLWESYLHKHLQLPDDRLHGTAELLEHVTDARMRIGLAGEVPQTETDPHGRPIPREADSIDA